MRSVGMGTQERWKKKTKKLQHVHKQKKNESDGRRPIQRCIWSNGRDAGFKKVTGKKRRGSRGSSQQKKREDNIS